MAAVDTYDSDTGSDSEIEAAHAMAVEAHAAAIGAAHAAAMPMTFTADDETAGQAKRAKSQPFGRPPKRAPNVTQKQLDEIREWYRLHPGDMLSGSTGELRSELRILGRLATAVGRAYRFDMLPPAQIIAFDAIPGWQWKSYGTRVWREHVRQTQDDKWILRAEYAKELYESHSGMPIPKRTLNWLANQRYRYRKGQLSQDRIAMLETIKGWSWWPQPGPKQGDASPEPEPRHKSTRSEPRRKTTISNALIDAVPVAPPAAPPRPTTPITPVAPPRPTTPIPVAVMRPPAAVVSLFSMMQHRLPVVHTIIDAQNATAAWMMQYASLVDHTRQQRELPPPLQQWASTQRENFDRLAVNAILLLATVPGWTWGDQERDQWMHDVIHPTPEWTERQRQAFAANTLSPGCMRVLAEVLAHRDP